MGSVITGPRVARRSPLLDRLTGVRRRDARTLQECFMDLVEADKHYPCAKKAWVEFL